MILAHINWLAVLVAAAFNVGFGALWFGGLFSKPWMEAMGITLNDIEDVGIPQAPAYVASSLAALVLSVVTALFVDWLDLRSMWAGAGLGALAWLGFNATSFIKLVFWEDRRLKLFLIDAGYDLISFMVIGALLAGWR